MTKRERVTAAVRRQPVDRLPVAFWRHVPDLDHDPKRLAEAMLGFHRRWDLDLIKLMSSGVYCVEDWGCTVAYTGAPNGAKQCTTHAVRGLRDWGRIGPLDPGAGALGRELEALRLVARGREDDAPILMTVFSPLTIARKLAGERLREDLRARTPAVLPALEAITVTMERYVAAALGAGADGVFFALQTASPETCTESELVRFDLAFSRRILAAARPGSSLTLVHAHGERPYFDRVAALPADALSWHDRLTVPTLAEARARSTGALVGGLSETTTLRHGPAAAVAAEVEDAARQTAGLGLIVAPGCVLPLDVPDASLEAAVGGARSITPGGGHP